MDHADDKSTELKLDPDLVGHDPELAEAVESLRQGAAPGGPGPRTSHTASAERSGERHVLNVPSGFLTRALPLYWPPPATAADSRRRYARVAVVVLLLLSVGLCVVAYLRGSSGDSAEKLPARVVPARSRPPVPSEHAAVVPITGTAVATIRAPLPTSSEATSPAPLEQTHLARSAPKSAERTTPPHAAVEPPSIPPSAAASPATARKSWFEIR
jgi:hypothetical protein